MKKIVTLFLALAALLSLCACGEKPGSSAGTLSASGAEYQSSSEGQSAREDGVMTMDEFFLMLDDAYNKGAEYEELMMDELSYALYGFAGASASAMRLAVEKILWLRGEGGSFSDFVADSPYTDWDTIAEISYFSPYPYYFEGMLHDLQGETDEAVNDYAAAAMIEDFPAQGLDFLYLGESPIEELYALRDRLREAENRIYGAYRPVLYGYERSEYYSMPEYHCMLAAEKNNAGEYADAVNFARFAIRGNPLDVSHWQVGALCATNAHEYAQATEWISEGLACFPEDEMLLYMEQTYRELYDEYVKEAD